MYFYKTYQNQFNLDLIIFLLHVNFSYTAWKTETFYKAWNTSGLFSVRIVRDTA